MNLRSWSSAWWESFEQRLVDILVRLRMRRVLRQHEYDGEGFILFIANYAAPLDAYAHSRVWALPVRRKYVTEHESLRLTQHHVALRQAWHRSDAHDDVFREHDVYYVAKRIGSNSGLWFNPPYVEMLLWLPGPDQSALARDYQSQLPYFWKLIHHR